MMLLHSGAPANHLAECLHEVCNACNRVVRTARSKAPQELLTGVKPTVADLRTFGCKVWARVPDKKRKALEPNALAGVLQC